MTQCPESLLARPVLDVFLSKRPLTGDAAVLSDYLMEHGIPLLEAAYPSNQPHFRVRQWMVQDALWMSIQAAATPYMETLVAVQNWILCPTGHHWNRVSDWYHRGDGAGDLLLETVLLPYPASSFSVLNTLCTPQGGDPNHGRGRVWLYRALNDAGLLPNPTTSILPGYPCSK